MPNENVEEQKNGLPVHVDRALLEKEEVRRLQASTDQSQKVEPVLKIPTFILTAAMTAIIAVQGWTLLEIINLKVAVATLTVRLDQTKLAKQ